MGIASGHSDPKGLLGLAGLTMDDIRDKCAKLMKERLGTQDDKKDTVDNVKINKVKTGDTVRLKDNAV